MNGFRYAETLNQIDADVGDDADIDGLAQTLNSHEIQAVAISSVPLGERLRTLLHMRHELKRRVSTDRGSDLAPLIDDVDHALDSLGIEAHKNDG